MAHVKEDRVRRSWHCCPLAPCLILPGPLAQSPFERSERTCGEEWASTVAFPRVPSSSWIGCSCPELYDCNLNSCNRVLLLWKRRRIGHRHPSSNLPWFSEDLWAFPRFGDLKILPCVLTSVLDFTFCLFPSLRALQYFFFMLLVCWEKFTSVSSCLLATVSWFFWFVSFCFNIRIFFVTHSFSLWCALTSISFVKHWLGVRVEPGSCASSLPDVSTTHSLTMALWAGDLIR